MGYILLFPYLLETPAVAKKKKADVNKAAEIRKYLAANPTAKGVEVVAALKQKGITVAPAQVSNVKTAGLKKKSRKGRSPVAAAMAKNEGIGSKSLHVIEAAFTMLEHMSVDAAKSILDRLSRKAK
jgi:hypothetical protein